MIPKKSFFYFIISILLTFQAYSQSKLTIYDTLIGSDGPGRSYDVSFYDLNLEINPATKRISGYNNIYLTATKPLKIIQIDLSTNYTVDSILIDNAPVNFNRDSGHIYIKPVSTIESGTKSIITFYYSGHPPEAKNPPWDGGFVWKNDSLQRPWIGVACEGLGASSWWPCKDTWSDEPDSMQTTFIVPRGIICISNGKKIKETNLESGKKKVTWKVHYPINAYNTTVYLGFYSHFSDTLVRSDGTILPLDYYVLDYNLAKAKMHFKQVPEILSEFENLFGKYPFQKDGYALAEAPYWGMEHQSAIAYGNNYQNNLLKYDYIIVHETAHEWWGNSITAKDHGLMWIHEAFATYSEALLVEKKYNLDVAVAYLFTQKPRILNERKLEGPLGVNFHDYTDTDMYFKGSWMLHTIRNIVNNDSLWFNLIKSFAIENRLKIIGRENVVSYFNNFTGMDLTAVFSQYLDNPKVPILVYTLKKVKRKTQITFHWETSTPDLDMPVEVLVNDKPIRIFPNKSPKSITIDGKVKTFQVNEKKFLALTRAL